jgi:hypothetical protein
VLRAARVRSCARAGRHRFLVADKADRAWSPFADKTRCDLPIVEGNEGAGESVDSDPVVPTVGAN